MSTESPPLSIRENVFLREPFLDVILRNTEEHLREVVSLKEEIGREKQLGNTKKKVTILWCEVDNLERRVEENREELHALFDNPPFEDFERKDGAIRALFGFWRDQEKAHLIYELQIGVANRRRLLWRYAGESIDIVRDFE